MDSTSRSPRPSRMSFSEVSYIFRKVFPFSMINMTRLPVPYYYALHCLWPNDEWMSSAWNVISHCCSAGCTDITRTLFHLFHKAKPLYVLRWKGWTSGLQDLRLTLWFSPLEQLSETLRRSHISLPQSLPLPLTISISILFIFNHKLPNPTFLIDYLFSVKVPSKLPATAIVPILYEAIHSTSPLRVCIRNSAQQKSCIPMLFIFDDNLPTRWM